MEMREINNLDDFELIKDKWNSLLETIQNKNIFSLDAPVDPRASWR